MSSARRLEGRGVVGGSTASNVGPRLSPSADEECVKGLPQAGAAGHCRGCGGGMVIHIFLGGRGWGLGV